MESIIMHILEYTLKRDASRAQLRISHKCKDIMERKVTLVDDGPQQYTHI
jgi:hypothetical protein